MRERPSEREGRPPWHVPLAVEDVPETGQHLDLVADDEARAAVARVAGLRDLPRLQASFDVTRQGSGLRVQGQREGADAVIEGVIKKFYFGGVLLDDKGRARIYEVTIEAAVTVRDQQENRVLYDNQNFVFRGEFEVANDPRNFFNEEDPAVLRIARSFAESIVSTLINGFSVKD